MEAMRSASCCFCPSECSYAGTCPHLGQIRILDGTFSRPDSIVCFTPCHADRFGDMESFLLMKKMFILKECGYWRSCGGRPATPLRLPEILTNHNDL